MTEIIEGAAERVAEQLTNTDIGLRPDDWMRIAQTFFDQSENAIAITKTTSEGREIVYVNSAFLEMLGYESFEALGQFDDFWDLTAGPETLQHLSEKLRAGETLTVRINSRRADGSLLAIDLTAIPTVIDETLFVIGAAKKVTERPLLLEPAFVVCSYCDNVRDPEGPWTSMQTLIQTTNRFTVSHGICPVCFPQVRASEDEQS